MSTLFIGNFFLSKPGTKSISQKLVEKLESEKIQFIIGSKSKNKVLRIFEIIFKTLFFKYKNIHVDVFSNNAFNVAILVCILNKVRHKKLILNLRGGKLKDFYGEKKSNKLIIQFVLQSANQIISPSQFLVSFFSLKGYEIEYLPNYISLNHFPYNNKLITNNKLLWVRGFHEIYNPKDAIYALSHLIEKIPNASLTMIGPDKGKLNEVIELINELDLTHKVSILGPVENKMLHQYFHSHTVLINTTSYESFGQALLESSACGCPIVSNNVGEIPFLWKNHKNIILSEVNNPKEMAEKLASLMLDINLLRKLKENAYEKSKNFDWSILKKSWHSLLN
jgi:glycosyltransferase involved in cell wall biosynthesis